MEKILTVYRKLKELRDSGVKMKDIAFTNGITSSVLSSLYRTILPSYISNISSGMERDKALDEALTQVNNISKRKFFELIEDLEGSLDQMVVSQKRNSKDGELFFEELKKEALKLVGNTFNYDGFYLGYSKSSYKKGLKIEPMMILPPENGELMQRAASMNAHNQIYWGNGLFTNHQMSYLFFNEWMGSHLGLKVVYVQLPMIDSPNMIRGIYITHDYSRNPIARRVVYVKQSEITLEEFQKMSVIVKDIDDLNKEEMAYYKYTSEKGDYIHSIMPIASPESDIEELEQEKKILNFDIL